MQVPQNHTCRNNLDLGPERNINIPLIQGQMPRLEVQPNPMRGKPEGRPDPTKPMSIRRHRKHPHAIHCEIIGDAAAIPAMITGFKGVSGRGIHDVAVFR